MIIRKAIIIPLILASSIAAHQAASLSAVSASERTIIAMTDDEPEFAPIIEREMDYYDFTLNATDGQPFNLRRYASDKRLVIVGYIAGWCKNSIQNGPVIKRLYDKYRDRGLGIVAVSEYSTAEELEIYINRIGLDCPLVTETDSQNARKKSVHYKYRQRVGDRRKWGTPFYIIIAAGDIEPDAPKAPLSRRIHTVSGEIVESEAEQFIEKHLVRGQ